jgi:Cu(I)/Ag(I) efflux system membrane fusion protein
VLPVALLAACKQTGSPANEASADPHAGHTMPMPQPTKQHIEVSDPATDVTLNTLLQPTQATVISQVRTVRPERKDRVISFNAPGLVSYDTRNLYGVSLLYGGRIEKLYAKYNFQPVRRGELLMDIYSPELLTAQQNLIFLLENDPSATDLIAASEKNLQLIGLTAAQIQRLRRTRKPYYALPVYSPYSGYLRETGDQMAPQAADAPMNAAELTTTPLSLREGTYVQKGQTVFRIYDNSRVWAVLNIYPADADKVEKGQTTEITLESRPGEKITGTVDFIEPFYAENAKSVRARVYLPNPDRSIRIGSLLTAKVSAGKKNTLWIPRTAVYDLGQDKIVWISGSDSSFTARRIQTGVQYGEWTEVKQGVSEADVLAADAQFLIDSESFIKISQR